MLIRLLFSLLSTVTLVFFHRTLLLINVDVYSTRIFLRLGNPLNCLNLDEVDTSGGHSTFNGPVPLTRIKTLVSMTTPRDFR